MGSKYKNKHKQTQSPIERKQKAFSDKYAYCSNCGRKSFEHSTSIQYSKCNCGGTYQSFGFST